MLEKIFTMALLASYCCSVPVRSDCSTNGVNGTCIPINKCHSVLKIVKNVNITQQDLEFLKKSHCGLKGTTPKVCCPKTCITPASENGNCVNIYTCPSLAKLLEPPLSKNNVLHIQDSRCQSSEENAVCCPHNKPSMPVGNCSSSVNAFPVDPATECCGLESAVGYKKSVAQTSIYQYPWLVALEYYYESYFEILASGALISARYVVTAAQVMTGVTSRRFGQPLSVRLGEYEITNAYDADCVLTNDGVMECTDGMIRIDTELNIPHPDFKADWTREIIHDIGLIRLKNDAPYTDFIRPICLPSTDLTIAPPANFTMFVAGWGSPNSKEKFSKLKLQVDLPYVDKERCQAVFSSNKLSLTGQVCAGGVAGKGTCSGDAGAPLVYQNGKQFEIFGIASFGLKLCGLAVPGVYTKVFDYLPWIRKTINDDYTTFSNIRH